MAARFGPEGDDGLLKQTLDASLDRMGAAFQLGEFGCRGYDTFGPFKLMGGIARGRPNEADLAAARAFYRDLVRRQGGNA